MWEMQNSPLGSDGRGRRFHQKLPIPNEALLEIREPIINITFFFCERSELDQLTSNNACDTQCLKITQNVAFEIFNFGIFTNFCPIKTDLSGNTV